MPALNKKEKELVALGAALGSNCVPCIVYHVGAARACGIDDEQIREAIALADKVRKMPSDKVLNTALAELEGRTDDSCQLERCKALMCEEPCPDQTS